MVKCPNCGAITPARRLLDLETSGDLRGCHEPFHAMSLAEFERELRAVHVERCEAIWLGRAGLAAYHAAHPEVT